MCVFVSVADTKTREIKLSKLQNDLISDGWCQNENMNFKLKFSSCRQLINISFELRIENSGSNPSQSTYIYTLIIKAKNIYY